MKNNPISCTIDFNKNGIQHSFLHLPYSSNTSAWGAIMIPITHIKNGRGPTALITGGNHGDEYEGPIALHDFVNKVSLDRVNGRIIIVPTMNHPAFVAQTRLSPIDNANLNRVFPGKPDGTVTQIIADYFTRYLLPMANYVLDIHSGGKTLNFLPFAASHQLENSNLDKACEQAAVDFGAPYNLKMLEIDSVGMYDTQVESMNKVFVTTELGGGGTTNTKTLSIAKRGIENFLIHSTIYEGSLILPKKTPISLAMPDDKSFLFAEHTGLLEPCVDLEDFVKEGDLVAKVYNYERMAMPNIEYYSKRDGIVIAKTSPPIVHMGDTLLVVAEVLQPL